MAHVLTDFFKDIFPVNLSGYQLLLNILEHHGFENIEEDNDKLVHWVTFLQGLKCVGQFSQALSFI